MKLSFWRKLYISSYMKYCDITHTKFLKLYLVVFKYDNVVDYFKHVPAMNKKDAKDKIKLLLLNSKLFDIKDKKTLQIIVIKEDEDDI